MQSWRRRHRVSPLLSVAALSRRGGAARALIAAALLIGLAFNPIGAVVHAWEHLAKASDQHDKSLHANAKVCEICAAYAALEHATPVAPLFIAAVAAEPPTRCPAARSATSPRFFHYRPRAPPTAPT